MKSKERISDSVYSKTEQKRHEEEVKYVSQHDAKWIKEFLAGVQEKRGTEAYNRLRNDVLKLWRE